MYMRVSRVEVLVRALGDELGAAPDLDEPRSAVGSDDEQADLMVAEQVAAFVPLTGRVHQRALAVQVDPYHGRRGWPW